MSKFLNTLSETSESERAGAAVRKDFASAVTKTNAPQTLRFLASTNAVDRHGDVVEQDWQLDNFRKNPIIMWNHIYSDAPIGRAVSINTSAKGLVVEIEFAPSDFGQQIYALCLEGFIRSVSVGFISHYFEPIADGGLRYLKNELLEISVCGVPSNPEALRLKAVADESGISESEFKMLVEGAAAALDDFTKRVFGPTPEPEEDGLTEADLRLLIEGAKTMIDEFLYKHTGRIAD
jgi:HK97 family phage prohead protease